MKSRSITLIVIKLLNEKASTATAGIDLTYFSRAIPFIKAIRNPALTVTAKFFDNELLSSVPSLYFRKSKIPNREGA